MAMSEATRLQLAEYAEVLRRLVVDFQTGLALTAELDARCGEAGGEYSQAELIAFLRSSHILLNRMETAICFEFECVQREQEANQP